MPTRRFPTKLAPDEVQRLAEEPEARGREPQAARRRAGFACARLAATMDGSGAAPASDRTESEPASPRNLDTPFLPANGKQG